MWWYLVRWEAENVNQCYNSTNVTTWTANVSCTKRIANKQNNMKQFKQKWVIFSIHREEQSCKLETKWLAKLQPWWRHYLHHYWQQLRTTRHPVECISTSRMYVRLCSATDAEYHPRCHSHTARHLVRIARNEPARNDLWTTLHIDKFIVQPSYNEIQSDTTN